ncbi:HNH endonuclease signature motif containing protein [Streptacidiphilus sp. EB103A]|uniref:HNH endonuclease signature motif containing protein n=1 Tax=Streptacidiphilus sp. EB103A TaxID=3156275 RepID=UPI0035126E7E
MATTAYTREHLAETVTRSSNWCDLMRRLGRTSSGGLRRQLQRLVIEHGIDTSHFKQQSGWARYSDAAIADAVARSTTMREVALHVGAVPASGTLSHLRTRAARLQLDMSHFPLMPSRLPDLDLDQAEVVTAAALASSIRDLARRLGLSDDSASRKALQNQLAQWDTHPDFRSRHPLRVVHSREALQAHVQASTSFAEVMRRMGLATNSGNHRKIREAIRAAGLDTSHFTRRSNDLPPVKATFNPDKVLVLRPPGSARSSHPRLRRALEAKGVAYTCRSCGNPGEWLGKPMTLQIDHINGDWLDNRLENLRFLCPNCHSLTATWCSGNRRGGSTTRVERTR